MLDRGVKGVGVVVSIQVIGPAESPVHMPVMLGHTLCIITILDRLAVRIRDYAMRIGLPRELAAARAENMLVLELDDRDSCVQALISKSVRATNENGARDHVEVHRHRWPI